MKKLLVFFMTCAAVQASAQQQIEVGRAVGSTYLITADTLLLTKALQRTLGDGALITKLHIESVNAFHYLVGEGTYKGYYKMIAASLSYDAPTRTWYARALSHVSCSSAACNRCTSFTEGGKIIGCKCVEQATVSNQCNFNRVEASPFFSNLARAIAMKKK
jgi:hypothetical protein